MQAASLRIAEQYIHAFGNIAKEVNDLKFVFDYIFLANNLVLHRLLF